MTTTDTQEITDQYIEYESVILAHMINIQKLLRSGHKVFFQRSFDHGIVKTACWSNAGQAVNAEAVRRLVNSGRADLQPVMPSQPDGTQFLVPKGDLAASVR